MEHLKFNHPSDASPLCGRAPVIVGVVGSGNLEVLVESAQRDSPLKDPANTAQFMVDTVASGFAVMWEAVLRDFSARFCVGGLRFSINDNAAAPAVVSLRLRQALETLEKGKA